MSTETYMTWLVIPIVNTVLFGAGVATIMSVPTLATQAATLIPTALAASMLFAWPIAGLITPRLRLRRVRAQTPPLRRF